MKFTKLFKQLQNTYKNAANGGLFDNDCSHNILYYMRYDGFGYMWTKNMENNVNKSLFDFVVCNKSTGEKLIYFFRYKKLKEYKCLPFDFERAKSVLLKYYKNVDSTKIVYSEKSIHNASFMYAGRYDGTQCMIDRLKSEYDFKYAITFTKDTGKTVIEQITIFK